MNILITGSNGFIGSHLSSLLASNNNVLAISRNFDHIDFSKKIDFFQCDMNQYKDLLVDKFEDFRPDVVIHCAWIGGNSYNHSNSFNQAENIIFSNHLLDLCSRFKIDHFVGFGTALEYGNYNTKITEEYICNPNCNYGISKYSFRMFSENHCSRNNIKFSWVIPFYLYGVGDIQTRLIPSIINKFLKNEDVNLNSCDSIVDYLHVSDFVKGVENIVSNKLTGVFNICSCQEYLIKDIVHKILELSESKSSLSFDSSFNRPNFQKTICGSSLKLQSLTKWYPEINIEEGLFNLINTVKLSGIYGKF